MVYEITTTSARRLIPKTVHTNQRLNIAHVAAIQPNRGWTETAIWPVSPRADYARMAEAIRGAWDYYPGSRLVITDIDGHTLWVGRL